MSLRNFLKRFNERKLQMKDCSYDIILTALKNGMLHVNLRHSIRKQKLTLLSKLLERFDKYIKQEEFKIVIKGQVSRRTKETTENILTVKMYKKKKEGTIYF